MRILVTGGAGFIGSHIVEHYLEAGYDVSVIDDLSTGNLAHLPTDVSLYRCSVTSVEAERLIEEVRPALLIHCAAQISVSASMADPLADLEVNVAGTSRLASAAHRAGVQRFVFISSGGAIYGETAEPATEQTPSNPSNYYGVHKLAAEYHVAFSGVPYAILRPSNVFGPRQRSDQEGGVVSIFVEAVRAGSPLTILGDGEQSRDFVHVNDVVDAVVRTAESSKSGVWNVSNSIPTSINELARLVEAAVGRNVDRQYAPARAGDVQYSCLDNNKLGREHQWTPTMSLESGLQRLVDRSSQ